jgi:membrane protein YqaA with SNARE-associated domain
MAAAIVEPMTVARAAPLPVTLLCLLGSGRFVGWFIARFLPENPDERRETEDDQCNTDRQSQTKSTFREETDQSKQELWAGGKDT